ncbi:Os11g0689800, partial [Oryza sativa Japonica Group]
IRSAPTGRGRGGGEGSQAWRTWTTPSPSPTRTTLSAAPWEGPGRAHHGDRLRGRSPRVRGARRHRGHPHGRQPLRQRPREISSGSSSSEEGSTACGGEEEVSGGGLVQRR